MEHENIVKKIKKLINLYHGSLKINSIHEAYNAIELAKKLSDNYHLDMVKIYQSEKTDLKVCHKNIDHRCRNIPLWMYNILFTVCNIYKCSFVLNKIKQENGKNLFEIIFIAPKEYMNEIYEFYMFLKKMTYKFSKKHMDDIHGNRSHWVSFAEGFTHALKVKSYQKRSIEQDNTSIEYRKLQKYLSDVDKHIVDYIMENFKKIYKERMRINSTIISKSYQIGFEKGNNENLELINSKRRLN